MLGSDNLMHFHTWKYWEEILHMMPILVVGRDCSLHRIQTSQALKKYPNILHDKKVFDWSATPNIFYIDASVIKGSATDIREYLKKGQRTALLSHAVRAYLDAKFISIVKNTSNHIVRGVFSRIHTFLMLKTNGRKIRNTFLFSRYF